MSTAVEFLELYADCLRDLPFRQVEFGCCGVQIFSVEALAAAQSGYSVSSDGSSLTGEADGDWRAHWMVIGDDLALGDPVFVDFAAGGCPVMTAMAGEGRWMRPPSPRR